MSEKYTPDEAELIGCYAGAMEEQAGENYATAKADAERGIAKIKADAVLAAVEKVLELHHGERDEYGCWTCRFCSHIQQAKILYPCATVRAVQSAIEGAINE